MVSIRQRFLTRLAPLTAGGVQVRPSSLEKTISSLPLMPRCAAASGRSSTMLPAWEIWMHSVPRLSETEEGPSHNDASILPEEGAVHRPAQRRRAARPGRGSYRRIHNRCEWAGKS